MQSGAILDVDRGMKHVSCIVTSDYRSAWRDSPLEPPGNIPAAAKNFPRHVLVVDDEALIRWSVAESLSARGVDVEQAADAASALRIVTNTSLPFDAVVLDLRLPDMNDLSLLGTLRQLLPAASLVLMTAFGTPEIVAGAQAMGASVITKPFDFADLNRLVLGPVGNAA